MKHAFGEGIQHIYTAGEAFRENRATRRFPGLLRVLVFLQKPIKEYFNALETIFYPRRIF